MKKITIVSLLVVLVLSALAIMPAAAHDAPTIEVANQVSLDGTVKISHVTAEVDGFVVIHIDNEGAPGPVAGVQHVHAGENNNVTIKIDVTMATPTLHAMLHVDDGEAGVYEFDGASGLDAPVAVDGNVVNTPFAVQLLAADPQFTTEGTFTVKAAVTDAAGFVVIHKAVDGKPNEVLGVAPLVAGNNADVVVTLEGDVTETVFPMLHVDTGEAGVYEFGTVEGADGPIVVDGVVATMPVPTVASIRAQDQVVIYSDNYEPMAGMMDEMMAPALHLGAVLAEVDGFVVAHIDNEGKPGPVAGVAPVTAGLNLDVMIELDMEMATPLMFPMLHVDDGTVGTYEFDGASGLDNPVSVGDAVVVVPVHIAPAFHANPQALGEGGTLVIESVTSDSHGWLVIHSSVDGAPNQVLGVAQVGFGLNKNVVVSGIDFASVAGASTTEVFPMLHYDTGVMGEYEFDGASGFDNPVAVGGNVVVGPLAIEE